MRKKVDPKLQTLLDNCIFFQHRCILIIIGDKGRDQVVNIHFLMSKIGGVSKPKVLWCYKKDLGFTTHQKKREKQLKRQQQSRSLGEEELNDPFTLFLSSQSIRYCYYAETQKILGNTYNLLVLQDFEGLTPNTLCRTIETVEGGGVIVFLLKTMSSLKQLYTMVMDVHQRYRTAQCQDVQPRFNERFILSLSTLGQCLFMDDELNLLPVSAQAKQIASQEQSKTNSQEQLKQLVDQLKGSGNETIQCLVSICKTLDQAKVVMGLVDVLQEKIFRYTVSVTAARGRGKSAAIGMACSAAVVLGFSNIYITAPSPENLITFFEFVTKGLQAVGMLENQHFDIIQSLNPEFNKATVRINIYKTHRQFVQYIPPGDVEKITAQADLVLVDEAASIPLPYVKKMFGQYSLVMSSTINGYEGTGRSLSLKLLQNLREQNLQQQTSQQEVSRSKLTTCSRLFKEFTMQDPIRYRANDPIERWLYDLLLLDATEAQKIQHGLPHPSECELYQVNRDTLFSYQRGSERFLRSLMSLFISSHYKNSPNDLQLLSDAPAHAVFVLLGPIPDKQTKETPYIPDILCVIQLCLEGAIPQNIIDKNADKQLKPAGDLIPWTLSKYYLDEHFPQLSGVRIVRIATHPSSQKMGYGSKAMELLCRFFQGQLLSQTVDQSQLVTMNFSENIVQNGTEKQKLAPILKRVTEIIPPKIQYLGVSYGLTKEVNRFWQKNGFEAAYLSLRQNDVTGEYSSIVLKALPQDDDQDKSTNLIRAFGKDFRHRFVNLLPYDFKNLDQFLCLDILQANVTSQQNNQDEQEMDLEVANDPDLIQKYELEFFFTLQDLQRLDQYCKNMADFYLILDLLPYLCELFFLKRTGKAVRMSKSQAAILIAMGLQRKTVEETSQDLRMEVGQILPLFNKAMRKMKMFIKTVYDVNVEKRLFNKEKIQQKIGQKNNMNPIKQGLDDELNQQGQAYIQQIEDIKGRQKRGKANYELDDINVKQIEKALENKTLDVVTIERQKDNATITYVKPQKRIKK